MEKRAYNYSLNILTTIYLWLMIAFSLVVVVHNVYLGFSYDDISRFDIICLILKVCLNLADIWAFYMILRYKGLGVWIFLTTTFFTILLGLAFPDFISPVLIYGIVLKALVLIFLLFKSGDLTGYQTIGMAKIDGHFIDEWTTGQKRLE